MSTDNKKLGFWGLVGIVFGSMIGAGIFTLAQTMAADASVGASCISWGITALGILFLVLTFKILADARPDLNAGIYQYAQVGFGNYLGYNVAWGYWLCTSFANVAFAVILNDTFGAFFPVFLDHGFATVALCTVLIWSMYALVFQGIRTAAIVNVAITAIKFMTLILIVILLVINFKVGIFTSDFWGRTGLSVLGEPLGSIGAQVRSTMMVTLWCFIGIEGAAMMSARARRPTDVGKAGIVGFILAWLLYALVSLLCFGIMSQPEMARLDNPSIAYVLKSVCGDWAYYFVLIAVIVSLLGGWVAWTVICAQVPYEAAKVKIMPENFLLVNSHGVPAFGLLISSCIMEGFLLIVVTAEQVYRASLEITGMMILPGYFFSGYFLLKATFAAKKYLPGIAHSKIWWFRICGLVCSLFCLYTIYSGGLLLFLLTSLFYIFGTFFFVKARKQAQPQIQGSLLNYLSPSERILFYGICLAALVSALLLFSGRLQI